MVKAIVFIIVVAVITLYYLNKKDPKPKIDHEKREEWGETCNELFILSQEKKWSIGEEEKQKLLLDEEKAWKEYEDSGDVYKGDLGDRDYVRNLIMSAG